MSPTNGSQTPEIMMIPIFDCTSLQDCKVIFDDVQLDDHFSKTFEYLGRETQKDQNILPEGIALVNIWNMTTMAQVAVILTLVTLIFICIVI